MSEGGSIASRLPASRRTPAALAWARSVERVQEAAGELCSVLDDVGLAIADAVDAIASGESMSDLVARTRLRAWRRLAGALARMTSALAASRAAAIRVIVDDEGSTMTDVARALGVARQVASRLYHTSAGPSS